MDITRVKQLLKVYCKQNQLKSPKYKIEFVSEEEYKKIYTISVEIKGVLTVADSAISRRIAEKKAAIKALVELNVINAEEVKINGEDVLNKTNLIVMRKDLEIKKSEDRDGIGEKLVVNNRNDSKGMAAKGDEKAVIKAIATELAMNQMNRIKQKSDTKLFTDKVTQYIDEDIARSNKEVAGKKMVVPLLKLLAVDSVTYQKNQKNQSYNQKSSNDDNNNNHKVVTNSAENLNSGSANRLDQLGDNSIASLIKFCLRHRIPLPFYDFNFNDGVFCTQCRVELNSADISHELIGFGRSPTLKTAKMIASQQVIDQLIERNVYYSDGPAADRWPLQQQQQPKTAKNIEKIVVKEKRIDYQTISSCERFEKQHKQYSSLTTNGKVGAVDQKSDKQLFGKQSPPKSPFEDLSSDSEDAELVPKNNSSTIDSRDDNNNRKQNKFHTFSHSRNGRRSSSNSSEEKYRLIIDNPIAYLQKYCSKNKIKAEYRNKTKKDRPDCPLFTFECLLVRKGQQICGTGLGNSAKNAKKAAAEDVIRKLWTV